MSSIGWAMLTKEGQEYFRKLQQLEKMHIEVGFQEGQTYDDGTPLAEIAAFNEFGTSDVPARPFMKQAFEDYERQIHSMANEVNSTLSQGGSVETALDEMGVQLKGVIQKEIVAGQFEPNAPSTVRSKGSDKPLIDTGHMRQSVQYVVKGD